MYSVIASPSLLTTSSSTHTKRAETPLKQQKSLSQLIAYASLMEGKNQTPQFQVNNISINTWKYLKYLEEPVNIYDKTFKQK